MRVVATDRKEKSLFHRGDSIKNKNWEDNFRVDATDREKTSLFYSSDSNEKNYWENNAKVVATDRLFYRGDPNIKL